MEHSYHAERQAQQRWRQSNRVGEYFASPQTDISGIMLYPSVFNRVPTGNKCMGLPPPSVMTSPPPPLPYPRVLYRPTYHQYSSQPPKTPPLRRRNAGDSQLISPPNPLRLATTNITRGLPRPATSASYFALSSFPPPPPYPICIGHPEMQVYKMKLPNYLIDGLSHIVDRSEQYVESLSDGWKTELYSLTKCDIACRDIPGLYKHVKPISKFICHTMKVLYGCRDVTVDKNQPHILKYSAESGYTGVALHHDRCDITANLALSRSDDYEGGGTTIAATGQVVRLELGEFLLHPGSLVHGGNTITAGTRYLMVTFADLKR